MAAEVDSRILTQTKKLSDGSYGRIFTRIGLDTYTCYLCSVVNLVGEAALQIHIAGKNHKKRLRPDYIPDVVTFLPLIQRKGTNCHTKAETKADFEFVSSDEDEFLKYRALGTTKKFIKSFNRPLAGPSAAKQLPQNNMFVFDENIIEKYRSALKIAINRIDMKYKDFEKSPEEHPDYANEWEIFWQKRYNELIDENKDAKNHNYKPEWINFWMPRMKELKIDEIKNKTEEIRKNLSITPEMSKTVEETILMDVSPKRARSVSPKRRQSPIEISDEDSDDDCNRPPDKTFRGRCPSANSRRSSSVESNDGDPLIITVCRLLSALDIELGIVAPRVLALLEKAESYEKCKPHSSDELLRDLHNVNFLDTIKERLKCLLGVNLVDHLRIATVKKAIRNIAALLHEAAKLKPMTSTQSKIWTATVAAAAQPDPVEVAKLAIGKVLTETLRSQGKTYLSAEEFSDFVDEFIRSQLDEPKEMQVNDEPQASTSSSSIKFSASEPPTISEPRDKSDLENLTGDDLKTLLRNFSDLTEDEQKHLIRYLEKLEKSNPRRVKLLSKYVDAGDEEIDEDDVEMNVAGATPVVPNISDDEYTSGDDAEPNYPPRPSAHQPASGFADSFDLADDLMSSLLHGRQNPPQRPLWGWDINTHAYYTQNPPSAYDPLVGYAQPITAMSVTAMPIQPQNTWGPGSSSFNQMNSFFDNRSAQQQLGARRPTQATRSNNIQLTGPGKNRR